MDKDGSFAKLPENVSDVYQQRLPVSELRRKQEAYQTLPSAVPANRTATVVSTPVAIEPAVQRQNVVLPQQEVSKTKNTVTTTTIRATP